MRSSVFVLALLLLPARALAQTPPPEDLRAVRAQLDPTCAGAPPAELWTPPEVLLRPFEPRRWPLNVGAVDQRESNARRVLAQQPPGSPERVEAYHTLLSLRLARLDELALAAGAREVVLREMLPWLEALPREQPNSAQVDSFLALGAWVQQQLGDLPNARRTWLELVRRYPQSPWVPYAYLHFGEYFLRDNLVEQATQFYERAAPLAPEGSLLRAFLELRHGTSLARAGNHRASVEHSLRAYALSLAHAGESTWATLAESARGSYCASRAVLPQVAPTRRGPARPPAY